MRTSHIFDLGQLRHWRSRFRFSAKGSAPASALPTEEMAPILHRGDCFAGRDEADVKTGRKPQSRRRYLALHGLETEDAALDIFAGGGYI